MKIRKTISVALLMTVLASVAYWLGYHHGRTPTAGRLRIATTRSLKQIGLQFRGDRNEIRQFTATGNVVAPRPETQDR